MVTKKGKENNVFVGFGLTMFTLVKSQPAVEPTVPQQLSGCLEPIKAYKVNDYPVYTYLLKRWLVCNIAVCTFTQLVHIINPESKLDFYIGKNIFLSDIEWPRALMFMVQQCLVKVYYKVCAGSGHTLGVHQFQLLVNSLGKSTVTPKFVIQGRHDPLYNLFLTLYISLNRSFSPKFWKITQKKNKYKDRL